MKKGELTFESLAAFIPHLLITIALLAVLIMLYQSFFPNKKTIEEQDFQRFLLEFQDLARSGTSVVVPIVASEKSDIVIYPAGEGPITCQKNACICLYQKGEKETCRIYQKASLTCSANCKELCISKQQRITIEPGTKSITFSKVCNEITFT